MFKPRAIIAALLTLTASLVQAHSQDPQEAFVRAFSGEWRAFDPSFRSGNDLCSIVLTRMQAQEEARYDLQTRNCDDILSQVNTWGIVENQLAFFAGEAMKATLGGSPIRVSGETAEGRTVILDREGASPPVSSKGCIYEGYSPTCTEPADRSPPLKATDQQETFATVLVKLNLRSQPRSDAPVVTILSPNTCITIKECVVASDGSWCKMKAGKQGAWARQTALRQEQWMVLTYKKGCAPEKG